MKTKQKGFALAELLIALIIFTMISLFYSALIEGNHWYTEDGVLRALQFDKPEIEKILKTTRNVWDYSEILVQEGDIRKTYYLDTGLLFNYEFRNSQDD